ncbi:MAG TPA: thiamine pyrophosphate-requiring protein [Anaeromyxobacteraceae bacterium]|nr:thiamine pyrophosphate-requiring protein [Anaeromyxobacteraceae bacterium]
MAAETVGDFILKRLVQWGVRRVFGYPGDGINGIFSGFHRVKELDLVQVRHEEMAAFMACAHAKFTRQVGVCMATSGPGAIHLLNGLYDARLDHQPVVAIVGQSARTAMGGSFQQEVDLLSLFKDVAGEYVQTMMVPQQARHLVDRAVRIALAERTVTCLVVPNDLQELPVEQPSHAHATIHTSVGRGWLPPRVVPSDEDLRRAADLLNAGSRVAMLVGAGARGAADEIAQVADRLGTCCAKALLGKDVLADDLPWVTGAIGLLGTKPSWDLMSECDTLLMVGTSFPYSEFLPKEGQARGVQIDLDGRMLALRYPVELPLVGDARETLRALLPMLRRKEDRSWRERIERQIATWWKVLERRAMSPAKPVNPQRVYWELSPRLPDGAILCADSGSSANWYARDIRIRPGMMASLSGNLATMGPGVPYAIAAKFAYPERTVLALVGDGAMQMNGLNELITIGKYWRRWKDPRLVVLVLNNRDLNQVTWEQRVMVGDPKLEASQDVPDFPYARYAESLGLRGVRVDRPEQIGPAWDAALSADRPCLVEVVADPEVPPLPPHITFQQGKSMLEAILKGDPARGEMIKQSWRQVVDTWFKG